MPLASDIILDRLAKDGYSLSEAGASEPDLILTDDQALIAASNTGDDDDDNDSVLDSNDANPTNKFVCRDDDNDGCDDCNSGTYVVGHRLLRSHLRSIAEHWAADDHGEWLL